MSHMFDICFAPSAFRTALLAHYSTHGRDLPWRRRNDPYAIWLSEIMLQQTTVATVKGYFERFLTVFPTIQSLADADEQDVLHLWQGLGYYSRARNLHKCAQTVVNSYNGKFPQNEKELLKLPGIGPYTAAAITAIAFNQPATVVDGNVERVVSRLFNIEAPLPDSKPQIKQLAAQLSDPDYPGDYAGAIMDLGATVCTPKNPACSTCPVKDFCRVAGTPKAAVLPYKKAKTKRPEKHGVAWVFYSDDGAVFLRQRPNKGLLASLWEVPHEGWESGSQLPHTPSHFETKGIVRHVFTHFALELEIRTAPAANLKLEDGSWYHKNNLPPLPTLMHKVLGKALED